MNKKIVTAILSLSLVASSMVSAHTTIDTAFIPNHVFAKFNQVIAKVDEAVLRNKVAAYVDQSFNQKLTQIVVQSDGSRKFHIAQLGNGSATAINQILDSSFVIAKNNLNLSSCIPIYPMNIDKNGIPNFLLTGYGFGKITSSKKTVEGIYFIKSEDVKSILTQNEYSFFITLMNKGLVRKSEVSNNKKTVEWTVGSIPIGQKEIYKICFDLEQSLNNAFDTLLKAGVVPNSFATLDQKGKVQYRLTNQTKALMAKYPKMKAENIERKPSLLILNNHGNLRFMLGWKLENTYKSGKKNMVIFPMQEATYFNKSVFLKYYPEAMDWVGLIF